MKNPQTEAEWQEAANLAKFLQLVDSARAYGLIEGGPQVNAERCEEILRRASSKGVHPLQNTQLIDKYMRLPSRSR